MSGDFNHMNLVTLVVLSYNQVVVSHIETALFIFILEVGGSGSRSVFQILIFKQYHTAVILNIISGVIVRKRP